MSLARVSPSVLDGQTPEQRDRVIDRWQRMLSGLDARTRFYFYLLRRPIHFPEVADGGGAVQGGDTRPAKAPGVPYRAGAGCERLYCVDARPRPIHRGRRSDRWAPVDGLREELDGAAKKRP